ncbi:hypothetical protein THRCLA_06555 [Thraustotheca clavata]|uniref:PX domain-containing protein n=1 Tax=Thraustotheca clavata TaxID=74557 RepID=A0A1V9ZMX2_9STRA|nr:hypothetical protein THRCLA_06555 [Thraustotheca clavata]
MNVSALIRGNETVGDHTEFLVQISCNGVVWLISRRFSDFDQLHCRLESAFSDKLRVRLPEKQWFGRFDPGFLAKRQAGLQVYLDGILQLDGITDDRSLQHFFEMEKNIDLQAEANRHSSQSNNTLLGLKHVTEAERWLAIVDKTAHALIDISEVPEPLEIEQANQKRSEILAAWTDSSIIVPVSNGYPDAKVTTEEPTLSYAVSSVLLQGWHEKLAASCAYKIQEPSQSLIAVMSDSLSQE